MHARRAGSRSSAIRRRSATTPPVVERMQRDPRRAMRGINLVATSSGPAAAARGRPANGRRRAFNSRAAAVRPRTQGYRHERTPALRRGQRTHHPHRSPSHLCHAGLSGAYRWAPPRERTLGPSIGACMQLARTARAGRRPALYVNPTP